MHRKQGGKTKVCVYYANIMYNLSLSYVLSEIYLFSSCVFSYFMNKFRISLGKVMDKLYIIQWTYISGFLRVSFGFPPCFYVLSQKTLRVTGRKVCQRSYARQQLIGGASSIEK